MKCHCHLSDTCPFIENVTDRQGSVNDTQRDGQRQEAAFNSSAPAPLSTDERGEINISVGGLKLKRVARHSVGVCRGRAASKTVLAGQRLGSG